MPPPFYTMSMNVTTVQIKIAIEASYRGLRLGVWRGMTSVAAPTLPLTTIYNKDFINMGSNKLSIEPPASNHYSSYRAFVC